MASPLGGMWNYPLDILIGITLTRASYESHPHFQHLCRSSAIKRGYEIYFYFLYTVSFFMGCRVVTEYNHIMLEYVFMTYQYVPIYKNNNPPHL